MTVVIAMLSLTLAACDNRHDQAAHWETEREAIELSQQLKLAEYRLSQTPSGNPGELERVENKLRELDQRAQALLRQRSALSAEIKRLEARNEELARLAIQNLRTKSLGGTFDTFSVNDGRTFEKVSITGVDDSGVAIRHAHGTARLRYAELTAEQRASFGLEERSALAAEDQERRELLAYERRIDQEMDALREKEERIAAVAMKSEDSRIAASIMARNSSSQQTRPLAQPASPFGRESRSSYGQYRYRSHRPTYRYVYYYPVTPNPFYAPRACRPVDFGNSKLREIP